MTIRQDYRNSPGIIEPVIYFERIAPDVHGRHRVIVAPDVRHPTPDGYVRMECRTLKEVDALTRRVNQQDQTQFDGMMERDRIIMQAKHEQIKSRLGQRLLSVDCSRIERIFILRMLAYMKRKEEEMSRCEVRGYFHQREFDNEGTDPIESYGTQLKMPKLSDRLAEALGK